MVTAEDESGVFSCAGLAVDGEACRLELSNGAVVDLYASMDAQDLVMTLLAIAGKDFTPVYRFPAILCLKQIAARTARQIRALPCWTVVGLSACP